MPWNWTQNSLTVNNTERWNFEQLVVLVVNIFQQLETEETHLLFGQVLVIQLVRAIHRRISLNMLWGRDVGLPLFGRLRVTLNDKATKHQEHRAQIPKDPV